MKERIENHIKENLKSYMVLALVLTLGLIIGIVSVNNLKQEQKEVIGNYLTGFTAGLKNNDKINYGSLLENSIKNNIKYILLIVLLSYSVWGNIGDFLLIGYKGFSLGYSISSAISIFGVGKGLVFTVSLILLSEIICIPSIFYITVLSAKTYRTLISGNYEDKRTLIIKYLILLLITAMIMVFASLLQTYLNTNLFLLFSNYF